MTDPSPQEQWQWDDLYFRHNFTDTGMYPTAGTLSASPDVIPAGAAPYSDPEQLIADENWALDFGSSTTAEEPNYIYLRGQNLGAGQTSGRLYLYASPSRLLMFPTDSVDPEKGWSSNPLRTSAGAEYVTVDPGAGERFVTPEPFQWNPQPIANDHYCLVGRVTTEEHPNDIPTVGNLNDFARYISEHPNMTWRNVITLNQQGPVSSTRVEYDQGDVGGDVYLNLVCENTPDDSMVGFSSGTGGPQPPISLPKTRVQNTIKDGVPTFVATLLTSIPAFYRTNITYTWYTEGKHPLPDMNIKLVAIMPAGEGSSWDPDLVRYSRPLEEFGIAPTGAGPIRGIVVGSQEMRIAPVQAGTAPGSTLRRAVPVRSRRPVGRSSPAAGGSSLVVGGSSLVVAGFTWTGRHASILSTERVAHQASIERTPDKGVQTEVLRIAETTGLPEPGEDADLTTDLDLNIGGNDGDTFVALTTTNVPEGCEVWFTNIDGDVRIDVPPTAVTTAPTFSISTLVLLPEEYQGRLRTFLRLNGNTLPADWSMKVAVLHVEIPTGESTPRVLVNAGPVPGTLLGAVTVAR